MIPRDPMLPSPAFLARVAKLRAEVQLRVLERAAILIYQAGLSPAEADERALAEEAGVPTQKALVA